MTSCHLIIDSCCDLPADFIQKDNVTLVQFPYIIGRDTFHDDLYTSISATSFYDKMRAGEQPSTAQLPVSLLTEVFEAAAENGTPTVYLSFSSGLSGSYDVAMLVRDQVLEKYPDFELYVVDTKLASTAEGMLVCEAFKQMEKGLSAKELADWAEEAKFYINCQFMVEDLMALHRGGRIPASVATAGSALDVKPILTIDEEGKLGLVGVARGRKKGIKQLVEYFVKNCSCNGEEAVCVVTGNADCEEDAQRLAQALQEARPEVRCIHASIGPVIGAHVGPGMIAVGFWGQDRRKKQSVIDRISHAVKGA